jgi:hypothetical protein
MGIYNNNTIYGIQMYNFDENDFSNILFEEKYDETMNHQQKQEAYLFYTQLNDKNDLFFKIYTECSSTYEIHNEKTFMMWHPISLNLFLEKFKI